MTVSSTSARNDYIGTGAVATYAYTFRIFDDSDLLVTKRDTAGAETTLTLTTDYTVTGAGGYTGGTITLTAGALPAGYTIAISRVLDLLQSTDLRNQGAFLAETHERVFDRLVMVDQQQQDQLDRSLRVPVSEAGSANFILPTKEARASTLLGFDANGLPIPSGALPVAASAAAVTATGTSNPRTLGDRFADCANVKDHGAVGDGVADDRTAFVNALATGKPVFVPKGTYKLSATLALASGAYIFGCGESSRIFCAAADSNVLSSTSGTGVVVRDLWIDNTSSSASTDLVGWAVFITGGSRCTVQGCRVSGYLGGICFANSSDCAMLDNVCTAVSGSTATTADFMLGCVSGACARNIIRGNRSLSAGTKGILLRAYTAGDTMYDNQIFGNTVIGKTYYGIHLYRQTTALIYRTIISGNNVRDISGSFQVNYPPLRRPGGSAIFNQGGEWTTIVGNTCTNTNTSTDYEDHAPGAIGTSDASCVVIADNVINSPSWYGIFVNDANALGNGKGVVDIAGNVITDSGKSGIKVAEAGSISIRGGSIRNVTAGIGIHIANTVQKAGILIAGVLLSGTSSNAIQVNYATNVRIADCEIRGYGNGGLLLDNTTRALVSGNQIDGNATAGLTAMQINSNCSAVWLIGNYCWNGGSGSYGLIDNLGCRYALNSFEGFTTRYSGAGGPERQLAASATPSVADGDGCVFYPNGSTTITNFTGGIGGMRITFRATGAIQVNHGSGITLQGAANFTMASGNTLSLVFSPGLGGWIETSRKT
jgi:parallel beta-helix repeat protein